MLQKNLLIMTNKSALSLKLPSRNIFVVYRSGCCCPARLARENEPEERSLGLIRGGMKREVIPVFVF